MSRHSVFSKRYFTALLFEVAVLYFSSLSFFLIRRFPSALRASVTASDDESSRPVPTGKTPRFRANACAAPARQGRRGKGLGLSLLGRASGSDPSHRRANSGARRSRRTAMLVSEFVSLVNAVAGVIYALAKLVRATKRPP